MLTATEWPPYHLRDYLYNALGTSLLYRNAVRLCRYIHGCRWTISPSNMARTAVKEPSNLQRLIFHYPGNCSPLYSGRLIVHPKALDLEKYEFRVFARYCIRCPTWPCGCGTAGGWSLIHLSQWSPTQGETLESRRRPRDRCGDAVTSYDHCSFVFDITLHDVFPHPTEYVCKRNRVSRDK